MAKTLDAIIQARRVEEDRWVKAALDEIIDGAVGVSAGQAFILAANDEHLDTEQLRSQAVQEVTELLIHEVLPILGRIRYHASRELPETSPARKEIEWLASLLSTIQRLHEAASSPRYEQFDLASLCDEVAENESHGQSIDLIGPTPLLVDGDRHLLKLILSNALRNAVEATEAVTDSRIEPIIVNWDMTDKDTWVVVRDSGVGLPAGLNKVFDIGTTSKTKVTHHGMGLALARQAAASLGASLSLKPRRERGASFEVRWPHLREPPDANSAS
jgi:Signal transduction histidine kinase